jgi:hypothetical protein
MYTTRLWNARSRIQYTRQAVAVRQVLKPQPNFQLFFQQMSSGTEFDFSY